MSPTADQVDDAVAGTVNTLLQSDMSEPLLAKNSLKAVTCHRTGVDLPDPTKSKTWANEYVDF